MGIIAELDRGTLEDALALNVNSLVRIDKNVGNLVVAKKPLEQSQSKNLIQYLLCEALSFLEIHRRGVPNDDGFEDLAHLAAYLFAIYIRQPVQVQFLNQLTMDCDLGGREIGSRDRHWTVHTRLPLSGK